MISQCKRCYAPATRRVDKKSFRKAKFDDMYCEDCAKDFITIPIRENNIEVWEGKNIKRVK